MLNTDGADNTDFHELFLRNLLIRRLHRVVSQIMISLIIKNLAIVENSDYIKNY